MNADDICANCGRDFADHNYVKDSIDKYLCPVPGQEVIYGGFCGGDPRTFYPDAPECMERELTAHREACLLWDEAESRGETPEPEKCPSGFIFNDDGICVGHVLRMPYGIGTHAIEFEQFFKPREHDYEE